MRILSIGFHKGMLDCVQDMLSGVDSWLLDITPNGWTYNITHERADKLWDLYKDKFLSYDVVITSDTALLSRVFLQNDYPGKLLVWVCNRFDYWDGGERPDEEYYSLLSKSMANPNVSLIGYTPYESVYCQREGIYLEDIIKPSLKPKVSSERTNVYYIPDYQNNHTFRLSQKYANIVTGRHGGIEDLMKFKAVLHLPYHWNGIANSEWLACGTPAYVPSKRFMLELIAKPGYWFQNVHDLPKWINICDFWDKRYRDAYYYFDSFEDITDIQPDHDSILSLAQRVYEDNCLKLFKIIDRWQI